MILAGFNLTITSKLVYDNCVKYIKLYQFPEPTMATLFTLFTIVAAITSSAHPAYIQTHIHTSITYCLETYTHTWAWGL